MKISSRGVAALVAHEGLALGPYKDSVGVWTVGVGHTAAAGGHDPKTSPKIDTRTLTEAQISPLVAQALAQFTTDLRIYEKRVNSALSVSVLAHQFDALVSFDFNTGGIFRAKLTQDINQGDLSGRGFLGWMKPKAIIARRRAERDLFCSGDYGTTKGVAVYDACGDGGLCYRYTMPIAQVSKLLASEGAPVSQMKAAIGWGIVAKILTALFGGRR